MNIEARIIEKFDTQEVTSSFKKREFVVEYAENPSYPEFIKFELIQSNCDQLNDLQINDQVNISFNLKGRKWTDPQGNVKYFNSLQAWRIDRVASSSAQTDDTPPPPTQEGDWIKEDFSADDDLPF